MITFYIHTHSLNTKHVFMSQSFLVNKQRREVVLREKKHKLFSHL